MGRDGPGADGRMPPWRSFPGAARPRHDRGPPEPGRGTHRSAACPLGRAPFVCATTPPLVITCAPDDTVEVVEVGYGGQGGGAWAGYDGIGPAHRLIDIVVAERHARGLTSTPCDIGHDFHTGFSVWSTHVPEARGVDQTAGEGDPRRAVGGVSAAPYDCFVRPGGAWRPAPDLTGLPGAIPGPADGRGSHRRWPSCRCPRAGCRRAAAAGRTGPRAPAAARRSGPRAPGAGRRPG